MAKTTERHVVAGYIDGELFFLQGYNMVTYQPLWTSDILEARQMTETSAFWALYSIVNEGAPDMESVHMMTYAQACKEARMYV